MAGISQEMRKRSAVLAALLADPSHYQIIVFASMFLFGTALLIVKTINGTVIAVAARGVSLVMFFRMTVAFKRELSAWHVNYQFLKILRLKSLSI